MTIALVLGVPETSAVWDLLADQLVELGYDEPLRLSPPGFGAPVPDAGPRRRADRGLGGARPLVDDPRSRARLVGAQFVLVIGGVEPLTRR
jgi:hypothetical protein